MSQRRISTPVSEDLYQRFTTALPWGYRSTIVVNLLEQICDMIEEDGDMIVKLITKKAGVMIHDLPGNDKGTTKDSAGEDTE